MRRRDKLLSQIQAIRGPQPYSKEWYDLRLFKPERTDPVACPVIFGASEAGAVCGVGEYETPLHIYKYKRQEIDAKEITEAMEDGHYLEPYILKKYAKRRGVEIITNIPTFIHPEHTCLSATPDALGVEDGELFNIDAKSITLHRLDEFGEEGTDELPDDIIMQAQQQMLVTGLTTFQETAVMCDFRTVRIYRVPFSEALADALVDAAQELAERIINGDPPEPDWTHASTPDLVKKLHKVTEAKTIQLDQDTALLWQQRSSLGEKIKELKRQQDSLRAQVEFVMGDANIAYLPDGEKEIVRRETTRGSYTVEACTYIEMRERKIKKGKK